MKNALNDKNSNYFKGIIQNLRILNTVNENFKKDIAWERQKMLLERGVPPEALGIEPNNDCCVDYSKQFDEPDEDVDLITKYNLSKAYAEPIVLLIEHDWKDLRLGDPFYGILNPYLDIDEYTDEKTVVLPLDKETSFDDIRRAWPQISNERDRLLNIKRVKKTNRNNLARDLEIFELKQAGKKASEIMREINAKYTGSTIIYSDVSKIIKRLRNKAKEITGGI
jgi:hypothetical protein